MKWKNSARTKGPSDWLRQTSCSTLLGVADIWKISRRLPRSGSNWAHQSNTRAMQMVNSLLRKLAKIMYAEWCAYRLDCFFVSLNDLTGCQCTATAEWRGSLCFGERYFCIFCLCVAKVRGAERKTKRRTYAKSSRSLDLVTPQISQSVCGISARVGSAQLLLILLLAYRNSSVLLLEESKIIIPFTFVAP